MVEGFRRLGDRLDAIDQALQMARQETQPERREQLLELVDRAVTAARTEHQAVEQEQTKRPVLRIIQGGAVAALITGISAGMRNHWLPRRRATVAAMAAAAGAAAAALVYLGPGMPNGRDEAEMPVPIPTVTVTHTDSVTAQPDRTPEPGLTTAPAPLGDEAEPTGGEIPAAESAEPMVTSDEPAILDSPSVQPRRRGRGTEPVPPPGLDRDGEQAADGRPSRDGLCIHVTASPVAVAEAEACLRSS